MVMILPSEVTSLVALLAEGVGRNDYPAGAVVLDNPSPSSRRAWVEILHQTWTSTHDWSPSSRRAWVEIWDVPSFLGGHILSPSSRRAWVEIGGRYRRPALCWVALLAEGVDKKGFLASSGISWAG